MSLFTLQWFYALVYEIRRMQIVHTILMISSLVQVLQYNVYLRRACMVFHVEYTILKKHARSKNCNVGLLWPVYTFMQPHELRLRMYKPTCTVYMNMQVREKKSVQKVCKCGQAYSVPVDVIPKSIGKYYQCYSQDTSSWVDRKNYGHKLKQETIKIILKK